MQKITTAIDDAYHIGHTLIFLREYAGRRFDKDDRHECVSFLLNRRRLG
jgi:hypothetical protein